MPLKAATPSATTPATGPASVFTAAVGAWARADIGTTDPSAPGRQSAAITRTNLEKCMAGTIVTPSAKVNTLCLAAVP